ncbi:hypothetical protein GCM10027168_58250 [Streptomyces capparidis]
MTDFGRIIRLHGGWVARAAGRFRGGADALDAAVPMGAGGPNTRESAYHRTVGAGGEGRQRSEHMFFVHIWRRRAVSADTPASPPTPSPDGPHSRPPAPPARP